jgi:hypothetical protein
MKGSSVGSPNKGLVFASTFNTVEDDGDVSNVRFFILILELFFCF